MKKKTRITNVKDVIEARGAGNRNVRLTEDAYDKNGKIIDLHPWSKEDAPIIKEMPFGYRYVDLLNPERLNQLLVEFGMWDDKNKSNNKYISYFYAETFQILLPVLLFINAKLDKIKNELDSLTDAEEFYKKEKYFKKMEKSYLNRGNSYLKLRSKLLSDEMVPFVQFRHVPDNIASLKRLMDSEKLENGENTHRYQSLEYLYDMYFAEWFKSGIQTELNFIREEIKKYVFKGAKNSEDAMQSIFLKLITGYVNGGESVPIEIQDPKNPRLSDVSAQYNLEKGTGYRIKTIRQVADNYFKDFKKMKRTKAEEATSLVADMVNDPDELINPDATLTKLYNKFFDLNNSQEEYIQLVIDIKKAISRGDKTFEINQTCFVDFRTYLKTGNTDDIRLRKKPGALTNVVSIIAQNNQDELDLDSENDEPEDRPVTMVISKTIKDIFINGIMYSSVPIAKYSTPENNFKKKAAK